MSNNPDGDSGYTYQPLWITKLFLMATLIVATFAIPYSFSFLSETVSAEENGSADNPSDTTPDDPGNPDTSGAIPAMLTFDADSSVPTEATISLSTPYEKGWEVVSQEGGTTEYNYTTLGCVVTTSVIDIELGSSGKDASIDVLKEELGNSVTSGGSSSIVVSELSYNITSTAQVVGIGSIIGGKYEWTYARGIASIDKGVLITVSCDNKEAMYEASDNLRTQFGILLKP